MNPVSPSTKDTQARLARRKKLNFIVEGTIMGEEECIKLEYSDVSMEDGASL